MFGMSGVKYPMTCFQFGELYQMPNRQLTELPSMAGINQNNFVADPPTKPMDCAGQHKPDENTKPENRKMMHGRHQIKRKRGVD